MQSVTIDSLKKIQQYLSNGSRKDSGFGKICQVLLAITFCRLGFQVKNHSSQGVDIDIWNHSTFPNFSIEVKTTIKNTVHLGDKDLKDWNKKASEGYETAFAVLQIKLLSDWIIAPAKGIRPGTIQIVRLQSKAQAMPELQNEVNQTFPKVVADYVGEIQNMPTEEILVYLEKCLDKEKLKLLTRVDK